MNILCALDLEKSSTWVIRAASQLGSRCNATLLLLHVLSDDTDDIDFHPTIEVNFKPRKKYYHETGSPEKGDTVPVLHTRAYKLLQTVSDWLKESGISSDISVVHGNPVDRIIEEAEKKSADMIMLGSHGHHQLYQIIMGSVSEGVLKKSSVPVIMVPPR
ncbi:universal stress protein [Prosthecochloris sp. N3]|uniref:Universal stress protein n=1 Tax=Prosthecochloris ethylica TaxID=2743976 RepID=A0ABR9XVQ3_9CHLB|nr:MULTISPECIES: universal stress protein [Prosthecochloris]MEC9487729.1 universal stress protein [Prosthecochloris sp.]MBF0587361.1 universal stress protein [Prosthecochloris ethylica]MBF0637691.1 universal stress protein [Prosthecochloris ethylica]NUK48670.1 universal stress protein [Prosthecochloris ethylica]RNA67224.1 universal stress protein [Prosthecochloris sp. ZM_2]